MQGYVRERIEEVVANCNDEVVDCVYDATRTQTR